MHVQKAAQCRGQRGSQSFSDWSTFLVTLLGKHDFPGHIERRVFIFKTMKDSNCNYL